MTYKIENAPRGDKGPGMENRRARVRLVKGSLGFMFALLCAVGIWQVQQRWQEQRQGMWASAPATIEQTRPLLVSEVQGAGGGVMLYRAEVLVRYRTASGLRQQWVTVRQIPRRLAEIEVEAIRWKGAMCTVRWNPANLKQIDVEMS